MRPFVFPLSQHIGAPSVPVVLPGDRVQRGQCIAEAGEGLGSPVYTSVSGTVLEVTDDAVIVRADDVQPKEYVPLTAQTPLDCIRQAGIVGLGGAGFPTYQKLAVPFLNGGVVIANASECEPVLNHNIKAIERDCRPMIRGLQLAMDLVHADKASLPSRPSTATPSEPYSRPSPLTTAWPFIFCPMSILLAKNGLSSGKSWGRSSMRASAVESRRRHHQRGNAPARGRSRR